jgi:hypothetical protein
MPEVMPVLLLKSMTCSKIVCLVDPGSRDFPAGGLRRPAWFWRLPASEIG